MRIGIIAEGRADLAVLSNVLKGQLGLDSEDIQFLRPEYCLDETDLHHQDANAFSNWGLVKQECVHGRKIDEFIHSPIDEERLVVIQIDTAEVELPGYDVARPAKKDNPGYAAEIRQRVIDTVGGWFPGRSSDQLRYAVAVEETDAWVLTIFSTRDTTSPTNPKQALLEAIRVSNAIKPKDKSRLLNAKTKAFEKYLELSRPFRNKRELDRCARRNHSLRLFIESL